MTNPFPVTLEERFQQFAQKIGTDVGALKQLTVMLEPGCWVTPYTGTIDAAYTSGRPMVDLPGGSVIGPCPYAASYTPHAGDSVLLVPAGQTYIVVCKIV